MSYDSRLKRKTLGSDQILEDKQNAEESSPLYGFIEMGLIAFGGYKLYKAGAFKEIAGGLMEYGASLAKEGEIAATTMGAIKKWSKLKNLPTEDLMKIGQEYAVPMNSIFRDRNTSIFYDLVQDLKDLDFSKGFSSISNFKRLRELMSGTEADMHILKKITDEAIKNLPNKKKDMTKTSLYRHFTDLVGLERNLMGMDKENIKPYEADDIVTKTMDAIIEKHTLTDKMKKQQLKESGYRMLTLGDIAELEGVGLKMKEGMELDLGRVFDADKKSLLERINDLGNSKNMISSSKGSIFKSEWKNLIIDENIRINEAGKIIDYRMSVDNLNNFKRSLAMDFKLPLVQFNPVKSALGWDKAGRKTPLFGYISPNQYNAGITGIAGQKVTVGEWMAETFGEEFRNKPISVIDGNLYINKTMEDGKHSLLKIGEGFRLHDISYADKSSGLKALHNAYRQMSGIKTNLGQTESTFKGNEFMYHALVLDGITTSLRKCVFFS